MGLLAAMTLPALVLALTALGVLEILRARRDRSGGHAAMASTGSDVLQEALSPTKKYQIEQRDHEALLAEQDDDGAPPRSRVDFAAGTAYIRLR
jgi:hypothetical protein